MPARRSRIAAAVTLTFLVGGTAVVVLAVVGVVRRIDDDAAWAALVLGLALAAWGLWFHRLGDRDDDAGDRDDAAPDTRATDAGVRDPLGTVAIAGIIAAGAYWLLRGPLDRTVAEAAVVAAITLGLWAVNRGVDAVVRRRRRSD